MSDFVGVSTLNNQTFLVTPRYRGQVVRLAGVTHYAVYDGVPVRVYGSGLVELSPGWWDQVMVVDGDYKGPYFDGSTPDVPPTPTDPTAPLPDPGPAGTKIAQYNWEETPHDSFSIYTPGIVVDIPAPLEYAAAMERLRRHIHTVTSVSGPTIVQKLHRGQVWGYIAEFVLVSGVPWTFGVTKPVQGADNPTIPEVIQDIPFNLAPYPSAEKSTGTVIVATNLATNPSVEVDDTGWIKGTSGITPAATGARSTELSADGDASYKVSVVATNSGSAGTLSAYQDVALPAYVAGQRFSFSEWAAAVKVAGTSTVSQLRMVLEWRTASAALTPRIDIGTAAAAGGVIAEKSLARPATATVARVIMYADVSSWSTGAEIALYVDALAVTIP